ncbi:MAG: hypothetical protein ACI4PR_03895 [Acutalibacteraceae bacterium]
MDTVLRVLLSSILLTVGITVTATGVATATGKIDTESAAKFFNEVFGRKEQVIITRESPKTIIVV